MKKAIVILTVIFTVWMLTSCIGKSGDPDLIGRVVDKDDRGRLLVISGIQTEEINDQVKDIISSGKYKEAYWIDYSGFRRVEIGDQVEVWFSADIADSYPAQTSAKKIEIVKE